jgi:protocatechuate 3,4-dioxygenase beta subunit
MDTETSLTRRQLLRMTAAFGGLTLAAPVSLSAAEEIHKWALLEVTPGTVSGPFYPLLNKPTDRDADLTVIKGRKERAQGQVLQVVGQVFNIKRAPVKGVQVELWQANAAGRYDHPADPNTAPLDPNFQGYGVAVTDGEGRYRFKTVMPGAYPVVPGWDRPPHLHMQLTGRTDRQITQMWFPDHPLNAQDRLFNVLRPAAQQMLTCKLEAATGNTEPDAKIALFNIILTNG